MPLLLAFGDSNTYGATDRPRPQPVPPAFPPQRYGADVRWPTVTAAALGWGLVEEGLPGRTAQFGDPVMGPHMDGRTGLRIALESHGPIDWLVLMLGTNDAKARFGAGPEAIVAGLAGLLDIARRDEMQARHAGFGILLICPPPVVEARVEGSEFFGAEARMRALPPLCAALAEAHGARFLDAGEVIAVGADGIHFDPDAQQRVGAAVAHTLGADAG